MLWIKLIQLKIHLTEQSIWQDSDSLERQSQLVIDGWTVIGQWLGDELDQTTLTIVEKEVLRLAIQKGNLYPAEVEKYMRLSDKTVKKILSHLVDKKL